MSSTTTTQNNLKTSSIIEDGQVEHVDLDTVSTTSNAPDMVDSDMDNGLETVSCQLATNFYDRYGASLHGITKRGALSQFYIDTYESWCPSNLLGQPRHFKQILFALANHTKKVRVVGGGRFLRWTDYQHTTPRDNGSSHHAGGRVGGRGGGRDGGRGGGRGGGRRSNEGEDGYRAQNRHQYQDRNHQETISDEFLDRIAQRLSNRTNN